MNCAPTNPRTRACRVPPCARAPASSRLQSRKPCIPGATSIFSRGAAASHESQTASDRDELFAVLHLGCLADHDRRVLVPEPALVGHAVRLDLLVDGLSFVVYR